MEPQKFKRHDRNYWEMQVASWRESGLTQSEYCLQNKLNPRSLSNWNRKLKQSWGEPSQTFVEISSFKEISGHDERKIEMRIGDIRITMREGIDPLSLRDIASALGGM